MNGLFERYFYPIHFKKSARERETERQNAVTSRWKEDVCIHTLRSSRPYEFDGWRHVWLRFIEERRIHSIVSVLTVRSLTSMYMSLLFVVVVVVIIIMTFLNSSPTN